VGRIDSVALDGRGGHGVVHGGDAVDDCRDDVSGEDVTARPRRDGRRQGACFGQGGVALDGRGRHDVVHGSDVVDDGRDDVSSEDATARPRRDGRRQGACFGQGEERRRRLEPCGRARGRRTRTRGPALREDARLAARDRNLRIKMEMRGGGARGRAEGGWGVVRDRPTG
jgi:hypothetical protein